MKKKILIAVFVASIVSLFIFFNNSGYLSFDFLKSNKDRLVDLYESNKVIFIAVYFLGYVAITSLSLPFATALTILSGAIFGKITGLILVSFASSLGASFACLTARYFFSAALEKKYPAYYAKINDGIDKNGWIYLLTLRLTPIIPYFAVNQLIGLTKFSIIRFFLISQIGMLPGTFIFVNAGADISTLESPGDILQPRIFISLLLLGIVPLIIKFLADKFLKKYIR